MQYIPDMMMKYFIELRRPFTVSELTAEFSFSRTTAFRVLKKYNILTSLNCRAQYYIYPVGLKFNIYGLYTVEGKCFSRWGNLLSTVAALANKSSKGITSGKIRSLVGTNVQLQLRDLTEAKKVFRKRMGKEYIYFSPDPDKRTKQFKRLKPESETSEPEFNSESREFLIEMIKILTVYIRNPSFSPKSIALSLCRRGENIKTDKVKAVFDKFNIVKKNS